MSASKIGLTAVLSAAMEPTRKRVSNVLDDLARNVTEISKQRAYETNGRQLHREAKPIVIATTTTDKTQIILVEEEEALQLQPRRHAGQPAVRAGLGIGEGLDRNAGSTYRSASSNA